jgi:hypothetical protein
VSSRPDEVKEFFQGRGFDSAFNRSEYQKQKNNVSGGGSKSRPVRSADNLTVIKTALVTK